MGWGSGGIVVTWHTLVPACLAIVLPGLQDAGEREAEAGDDSRATKLYCTRAQVDSSVVKNKFTVLHQKMGFCLFI